MEESNSQPQFAESNAGTVYDYSQAPDSVSMPDRLEIDGQVVSVEKAEIIVPPVEWEWEKSKNDPTKLYKACPFKVYMKTSEGQLQIENCNL